MSLAELRAAAAAWIGGDPDPATRAELQALVAANDEAALRDRLGDRLHFGTAGLRGEVGAGPNRMNRAGVIQTTRGLAVHALDRQPRGPVVVGYDARVSSRRFMEDTVGVLAAAGLEVRYFDEPTPTPLVAFAARRRSATAAVVITASHNPPQDNGYKVYAANAVQVIPPEDELIAAEISKAGPAALIPRLRWPAARDSDLSAPLDPGTVFANYRESLTRPRPERANRALRIVYTPLHGVGGRYVKELLESNGHVVVLTESQFEPDGAFPTVAFPNPEEPGALDEAYATASRNEPVDLIIANDPDADRLSVSVPTGFGWRTLTGNQVGVLLADWCLDGSHRAPLVINSVVSSPMLGVLAASRGAEWAATLTGFKWIWNAALDLQADGLEFVMGYEEALGYSIGGSVRDKDGMSAALVFADLAANCREAGISVLDSLARLYREAGLWASAQHSIRLEGPGGMDRIPRVLDRIVASPPADLHGIPVTRVVDYRAEGQARPRYLGEAPLVELELGSAGRCLMRPSGTEPKLKIYADLTEPAAAVDTEELLAAEVALEQRAASLAELVCDMASLE